MNRPKRERKKPDTYLIQPDDLDLSGLEDDEDGDFSSASSDDYDPDKSINKSNTQTDSSDDEEQEEDESAVSSDDYKSAVKKSQRSSSLKNSNRSVRRQSHVATLRREVIHKFKNSANKSHTNQKLQDILKKAQFNKKSRVDNTKDHEQQPSVPVFDCSGGLHLSDSESDDENEGKIEPRKKNNLSLQKKNEAIRSENTDGEQDMNGLKTVHDNLQKMKEIAEKLAGTSTKTISSISQQKENVNVADLLAMGETDAFIGGGRSKSKTKMKVTHQSDESDSDNNWEDVEDDDSQPVTAPRENVEILLNDFGNERGKQTKTVDVEAQIKRKFNKNRKIQQEYLHKAQLLSWIGHGNFVNSRLNDVDLMKSALKLLPNNKGQCYPKDKTDVDYFKQITTFYKQEMKLRNTDMYCTRLKNLRPPLMMSLALQMKFKAAICRRDYVLIFVTLLRAIGIQCRVVQSIVCDPKNCPKTELMSLSKKPATAVKKETKTKTTKSSKNKKSHKMKIPQLDGGDNEITKKKKRNQSTKGNENATPKKLPSTLTFSPSVKVSINSPNRIAIAKSSNKSAAVKKSKALEMTKKATLNVFSPRKTRSMSRDQSPKPCTSSQQSNPSIKGKSTSKKDNKETLKIVLPKTARSRSRSAEPKNNDSSKPNLNKLAKKRKPEQVLNEASAPKISKHGSSVTSRKREASTKDESIKMKKPRLASESSDEGSLKYFKLNRSKSNSDTTKIEKIDRRIISSDDEQKILSSPQRKSKGIDIWVEAYSEKEEKWISIDVYRGKVNCAAEIAKKASQPVVYAFAWNNDNSIKDVSARYCKDLNTRIRKMRVDREYLNSILHLYAGVRTSRDFKEDDELNKLQLEEGMPKSIAEFKNHPLYALKRHLLKYQAIYPPEPPILGYIRDEAIYPRDSVFTLHSRETWLKEARVVKLYEKAYKTTTTLKWDKVNNKVIKDVPLELFGIWQTKDYEPPIAENGIVPRNGYGNVELFKPCMLPIGTVHLQLPGLNRVCKKLGVDCAQAVIGFDSNGGWPFPVYDGFIVCKEFEEKVIDAWNRDRDEMEKKERDKIEKRVYGNWKKLIKGLLVREHLKEKYNFEQK